MELRLENSKAGWFVVSPIAVSPYLSIFQWLPSERTSVPHHDPRPRSPKEQIPTSVPGIPLLLALFLQCPRQAGHVSTAQHQRWGDAKAQLVASQLGEPNGLPWRNGGGFGDSPCVFGRNSEDPLYYSTKDSCGSVDCIGGEGIFKFCNSAVYS